MVKKTKKFAFKKVNKTKKYKYNLAHSKYGGGICTSKLGSGSYGNVYECKKNNSNNTYALKVKKIKQNNTDIQIDDKHEIELLQYLSTGDGHPNIIKVIDPKGEKFKFEDTEVIPVVLMEKADMSIDLLYDDIPYFNSDKDYFKPKSLKFTKDIFSQLFSGLKYLYEKSVCHFDIKPANILIKKEGDKYVYKITDFGLSAKITDSNKHTLGLTEPIKFSHVDDKTGDEDYGYGTFDYIPDFLGYSLYFRDLYALYCTLYWVYNNSVYNKDSNKRVIEENESENSESENSESENSESEKKNATYIKKYKNILYKDIDNQNNKKSFNYINTILAKLSVLQIKLFAIYHGDEYNVLKTQRDAELKLYNDFYSIVR